jgi:hypothetical protein
MIKACLAAASLLLLADRAAADTISFAVPVAGAWVEFPESTEIAVPGFNAGLGTLTGVTDTLAGTGTESLSGYGHTAGPFEAAITNQILEIGPSGQRSFTAKPFPVFAGPSSLSAGFGFDAIFTDSPLNHTGQTIYDAYLLGFTVVDETTGLPVHGQDSGLSFSATLTETFTYTPTAIPEPCSTGLFAAGALALMGSAFARRNIVGWAASQPTKVRQRAHLG